MKNNIIIAILIVALGFAVYKWLAERSDNKALKEILHAPTIPKVPFEVGRIAKLVDEKGVETAVMEENSRITGGQRDQLIAENDSLKKKVKAQSDLLGIRQDQITSLTSINSTLRAANVTATYRRDSISGLDTWSYSDDNLDLMFSTKRDSLNNAGQFNFRYDADLDIYQFWDRKWLLGRRISKIAITANDPRVTIGGVRRFVVEQKAPAFGLRIQGSSLFNPQTGSVGFGPAARIDLGRASVQYQHMWFPASGRWRPNINMNFDLIRF